MPPDATNPLQEGIALAKAGRRAEARSLLLQIVADDERNETAWLWLSGVVESTADRRRCLENVLAITPGHPLAQRGLARLAAATGAVGSGHPASQPVPGGGESPPPVDDVWSRETDICAYCAYEVAETDQQCPQCRRSLLSWAFRYEQPSTNFYLYLTALFGVIQVQAYEGLLAWLLPVPIAMRLTLSLVAVGLVLLTIGVAWRQAWAHTAVTGAVLLLLADKALLFLGNGSLLRLETGGLASGPDQLLLVSAYNSCAAPVGLLALLASAVLGLLFVRADFARRSFRLLGRIDRRWQEGPELYLAGRRLAEKELWAAAVLHWRRAVAREPGRFAYQQALGDGYARLGYTARAQAAYQAALRLALTPSQRADAATALAGLATAGQGVGESPA